MTTVGAGSAHEQGCHRKFAAEGRSYNRCHANTKSSIIAQFTVYMCLGSSTPLAYLAWSALQLAVIYLRRLVN